MDPKTAIMSKNCITKAKRPRKAISLAKKIEIIKKIEEGYRPKEVSVSMNLASSTISTILSQKEEWKKRAETIVGGGSLLRITKSRAEIMENLERMLRVWIHSHDESNIPLSFTVVREKALSLFAKLKKEAEEEGDEEAKQISFKASHGWFERFKKRSFLQIRDDTAPSTEVEEEKDFPTKLQLLVDKEGYSPKQIFSLRETGLFWKRMPSRTFISKHEKIATGYKASKDRLTLLIGGNLEGDVRLKPLLVYHTENP
ncbi:Tigger transposable element-derived protein 1, partial [Stegodyphus mimosarum]